MTHRTPAAEIFSKDFKNDTFMFDEQELQQQMQLSNGDNMAPSSPTKIFGSYVPKSLAEETDFVAREDKGVFSVPKFTSTSHGTPSSSFESSQHLQRKPWVIGDKHVPMTLGMVNTPDRDYDNIKEPRHKQLNKYNHLTHNGMDDIHKYYKSPSVSPGRITPNFNKFDTIIEDIYENEGDSFTSTEGSASNALVADNCIRSTFRAYSQHQQNMNTDEVLIPAPDYDEEEQVVYLKTEINNGQQIGQLGHTTTKHPIKIYEGADLSMYLNDDEVDEQEVATGHLSKASKTLAKTVKSKSGKSQPTDKYSFFKQQPKTKTQRKRKGKETTVFNTVGNFSYADSKSVNLGKARVDHSAVVFNKPDDDGERFLHANEHQSSYELFLRSRHGDVPQGQPASRDGSGEVGVGGSDSPSHNKPHTMWKKLTLRFKHT